MKPAALFPSLFLLLTPVCLGQQTAAGAPASKEDVVKLFEVMHIGDMTKQVMAIAMKQSQQLARDQMKKDFPNMPQEQAAQAESVMDDMLKAFPIEQILQTIVPVYQKHLTQGDMDAILAFYSSPAGQKLLKETPAMTQESVQASYGLLQQYMETVMQKVRQRAEQLQKDAKAKPTQQSSPKPN